MRKPETDPRRPAKATFTQKQRKLWQRLNLYIQDNDGWITSQPDIPQIRFECRTDSILPELLRSAGYDVRDAGTNERLLPVTELIHEHGSIRKVAREHISPQQVLVFEFLLPE